MARKLQEQVLITGIKLELKCEHVTLNLAAFQCTFAHFEGRKTEETGHLFKAFNFLHIGR